MSIYISQLVIDLGWVILIFGALIWAFREIGAAFGRAIRLAYGIPQKHRNKELIRRAREVGCVLVYNTEAGITAVNTASNLYHYIDLERGNIGARDKTRLLASPIRVMPPLTFTFADEDDGYLSVTGTTSDRNALLRELVHKVTGYQMRHVSRESWRYAESLLVRKDKRLLVPFIRQGQLPSGSMLLSFEAQCEQFGKLTIKDARRELLAVVRK